MTCENCRHLTVVGLHDTGPWSLIRVWSLCMARRLLHFLLCVCWSWLFSFVSTLSVPLLALYFPCLCVCPHIPVTPFASLCSVISLLSLCLSSYPCHTVCISLFCYFLSVSVSVLISLSHRLHLFVLSFPLCVCVCPHIPVTPFVSTCTFTSPLSLCLSVLSLSHRYRWFCHFPKCLCVSCAYVLLHDLLCLC